MKTLDHAVTLETIKEAAVKATMFYEGSFGLGYASRQIWLGKHGRGNQFAQHDDALVVYFVARNHRQAQRVTQGSYQDQNIVLVEGWDVPAPPSLMEGGAMVIGFDPANAERFDTWLKQQDVTIIADYRQRPEADDVSLSSDDVSLSSDDVSLSSEEVTPLEQPEEITPLEAPAYTIKVMGTFTWVFGEGPELDNLFLKGFRYSQKRKGWYTPHVVDRTLIDQALEPADPDKVDPDPKLAAKLRGLADGLDKKIEQKRNTHRGSNPTWKRQKETEAAAGDADQMEEQQVILRALADAWEAGSVPVVLRKVKARKTVERLQLDAEWRRRDEKDDGDIVYRYNGGYDTAYKYFGTSAEYVAAVHWCIDQLSGSDNGDRDTQRNIDRKIARLRLGTIPGYFATPDAVIDEMLDHVDLGDVERMLEPEAGDGAIVRRVLNHKPGIQVDCIEINHSLREILTLQGFNLVGRDFLEVDPNEIGPYDLIVMNPPFERDQDMEHVQHATNFLAPRGVLLSVMSPSILGYYEGHQEPRTKAHKEFAQWFEDAGGEAYALPQRSFKESGTTINTCYVVINA